MTCVHVHDVCTEHVVQCMWVKIIICGLIDLIFITPLLCIPVHMLYSYTVLHGQRKAFFCQNFFCTRTWLSQLISETLHVPPPPPPPSPPPPPPIDKTINSEVKVLTLLFDVHKLHCSCISHAYLQTGYFLKCIVKYMDVQLY